MNCAKFGKGCEATLRSIRSIRLWATLANLIARRKSFSHAPAVQRSLPAMLPPRLLQLPFPRSLRLQSLLVRRGGISKERYKPVLTVCRICTQRGVNRLPERFDLLRG